MKTVLLSAFPITILLSSCGNKPQPDESKNSVTPTETVSASVMVDTTLNQLYVIEVWETEPTLVDSTLSSLPETNDNANLEQRLVLKARNDERVVQITTWNSDKAAEDYASDKPSYEDYKVLTSKVANYGAKDATPATIDAGSSVQYSEFIMKRKPAMDTLSTIAKGMTGAMAQSESTLDYIMTLNSTDSSTISLFGAWNTEEGFEVFTQNNTFGDQPYWEPYAENEHHMFEVVIAQ
ncbi:MAG: hypothetical protein AAGE93_18120 [Bacteroidota bacterium]